MVVEAPREQMVAETPREHRGEKEDGYSLIADNHDDDIANELSTIPSSGGHQQNTEGDGFSTLISSSSESSVYFPEQIEEDEDEIAFPLILLATWLQISYFYF